MAPHNRKKQKRVVARKRVQPVQSTMIRTITVASRMAGTVAIVDRNEASSRLPLARLAIYGRRIARMLSVFFSRDLTVVGALRGIRPSAVTDTGRTG